MIANDRELDATFERIRHMQSQVVHLRNVGTNPVNHRLSASGFLAEINRMQLEVSEYLLQLPSDREHNTVNVSPNP